MGMMSEIAAYHFSNLLKEVLLKCKHENEDARVFEFCRRNLYPIYINECAEAFEVPNLEVLEFFQK